MKKELALISLISILLAGTQAYSQIIHERSFYDDETSLERAQNEFFETGAVPTNVNPTENTEDYADYSSALSGSGMNTGKLKAMPLFKRCRIKIQNHYRIQEHEEKLKNEEKLKELMKQENLPETLSEEDIEELSSRTMHRVYKDKDGNEITKDTLISRIKNAFKRKKNKNKESDEESKITKDEEILNGEKPLSGGVREVVAEKDMILDCDKLDYDDETSDLIATGHPIMSFPPQDVTIKADKLTYNTDSNIIKAFGNVEIIKDGSSIFGDYVMINMNDESSIVTNMRAEKMNMQINAKDVVASEDSLVLTDGSLKGEQHYILALRSGMVGDRLGGYDYAEGEYSSISKDGLEVRVKAKDVYVTAKKRHDVITVKDADIFLKNKYLGRWGSFTAHTNKGQEYFEADYPEFGNIPRLGMFAGPGFVFDVPTGASVKFIPFVNYKKKWGIGAALKYRSGTNYTEAYYGTSLKNFILRGRQHLDDRFYLQYGVNSYLEDWFLGSGMSKYRVEAVYNDSMTVPNTLGLGRNARYRHRISAGYVQDADYNRHGESLGHGTMGTTRFKYMAELSQNLFSYRNKKENINVGLSWVMQGSAAVYGTGDTQFIGRTGPFLHTQYKRWIQDIGYFLSAYDDHTPVPKFDIYRYGKSTVMLREGIRFNKYLTANWIASTALSNDTPNGKTFQENGFFFSIGPDDLKLTLGYDFIRERTYFLFSTALDLKGTQVDYKKMVIKNPDKLAKDDSEKIEPVIFNDGKKQKIIRTHAQVIEIEDPDREQL